MCVCVCVCVCVCMYVTNEKLIRSKNWSNKEMKNFIQSKLRIIVWEQHLRKIWVLLFYPLEVKAVIKFFETEGCTLNDVLLTQSRSASTKQWVIVITYKIRKEGYSFRSCLVDTRRMLLFVVEQIFLYIHVFLYLHVYKESIGRYIFGWPYSRVPHPWIQPTVDQKYLGKKSRQFQGEVLLVHNAGTQCTKKERR